MGLFRLLRNIEDDFITSNSAVAFTVNKTSNFLYQDRHGNWVVGRTFRCIPIPIRCSLWIYSQGNQVGDPRGHIRSNPKAGQNVDCPCKVMCRS